MLGRESPSFLTDHGHMAPELPPLMAHFPVPTGPDPLVAARMNLSSAGMNPMLAIQHAASLSHYMQNKTAFAGLFPTAAGYMLHSPPGHLAGHPAAAMFTSSHQGMPPNPSISASLAPTRFFMDSNESLDLRKSSIDALRLKAKEHAAVIDNRLIPSRSPDIKTSS